MGLVVLRLAMVLGVVLSAGAVINVAAGERVNKTASSDGALIWPTEKDEFDLLRKAEPENADASSVVHDPDHLDGGFSSLDGMLHWAIGNSDPTTLKERAQEVQRLSVSELQERQLEIKELVEKMKMTSNAELMQIAIDDLHNSSLSLEDRHRALQELLVLVEPIDNANYLNKLGGLVAVIRELHHPDSDIRRLSAWVLGTACQNNAVVQNQILELGALTQLIQMAKSTYVEEAIKALYAVSALIQNNLAWQELFYAEAGDAMLQEILSNTSNDIRLHRKAVFLVADLAERQLDNTARTELQLFNSRFFLKSVVDLTASTDLYLQEKALVAIKNLLQLKTTEVLIFKDYCDLDGSLERMRQQLQHLVAEDLHRDYAMDMETLRREVELIFREKLGKV